MDIKTTWGPPTTAVSITGVGLLDKAIDFGGQPVPSAVNTDDCLIFVVPSVSVGSYEISVGGQSVGNFEVAYPKSAPVINYVVSGVDNWYAVGGDQFYVGETIINVDGVDYPSYVISPQECAFVYTGVLNAFKLTTSLGVATYP